MTDLSRLIPIAVSLGFTASQADELQAFVDTSLDMTRVVAAKAELSNIRGQVAFALAQDADPNQLEDNFPKFVREVLHSDTKDSALDPWEEPYRFRVHRDEYELFSIGPDGHGDTDDDIWVVLPRR